MWIPKQYDIRPIVPGGTIAAIQYWSIPADPVDEENGGTYFRPSTEWITIDNGPSLPGIFSFPASTCGINNDKGGTVSVYLMFRNALDKKICEDLLIAQLVVGVPNAEVIVEGSDSNDIIKVYTSDDIINPGAIAKVRYKIVGPDGVTWTGGGLMGKLHG